MVKVSVIIPVYNALEYLRECMDSVLGQSLKDIEVICVDDGSTDSSSAILADYAARDKRVRVIKGDHCGAYKVRERAFSEITGEFVHFMDADDILVDGGYRDMAAERDVLSRPAARKMLWPYFKAPKYLGIWKEEGWYGFKVRLGLRFGKCEDPL